MRTINSPGVQITEKDLSLRINNPVGTTIFVSGFASQGPVGEPIQITSTSELESIFGTPTTAAERYFYYSCREILNSPGQLLAARLPYGLSAGTTHSSKFYSALFYPVALSNSVGQISLSGSNRSVVPEFLIGQPLHKRLTHNEYKALLNNNFDWKGMSFGATQQFALKDPVTQQFVYFTDQTPGEGGISELAALQSYATNYSLLSSVQQRLYATKTVCLFDDAAVAAIEASEYNTLVDFSPVSGDAVAFNKTSGTADFDVIEIEGSDTSYEVKAGFVVLNDIQSVLNEISEGFYFGFADNFSVYKESQENFDSIKFVETIVDNLGTTVKLSQDRLEFALTSTVAESDKGVTSVSETLEKVGFVGFEDQLYQDHLSMGLYRIRRSTVDPTKLSLIPTEKYLGSFDYNRKQANQAGGQPQTAFIENLINNSSPNIKIAVNPQISQYYDWTPATAGNKPAARVTVAEEAKKLVPIGVYVPDTRSQEETKIVGNIPLKLDKLFRSIESPENITVDVVVDGGLSTIFASTYKKNTGGVIGYDDEAYVSVDDFYNASWKSVAIPFINLAENTRKDCVAIIDPPRQLFVTGRDNKVIDQDDKNFTQHIHKPLKDLASFESNYATMYGNWIKVNDIYSNRRYWHPSSAYAAAVFARSDAATQPWYAPAGLNRGIFNAIDIAFNPNQKQRDRLYEISVNPICFFNGDGHVIMGQKTLQTKPTAFDRINVRRLFLTLERAVSQSVKYFVFEPNTASTRLRLVNTITPLFDFAKRNEGLYDYMLVCDERNNTPQTIDNNELIVDIYIKPVRAAEFILINFIATRTGQDFAELL